MTEWGSVKSFVLRANAYNFLKFHVLLHFSSYTAFLYLLFFFNFLWEAFRAKGCKSVYTTYISQDSLVANKNSTSIFSISVYFWVIWCSFQKNTYSPFSQVIWAAVHFAFVYKAVTGICILSHQCSYIWHWDNWGFHQPCKNIVVTLMPTSYSIVFKNGYKNF